VENWVRGKKFAVKEEDWKDIKGQYNLVITSADGASKTLTLDVKSSSAANVIGKDTLTGKFSYDGNLISLSFGGAPLIPAVAAAALRGQSPGRRCGQHGEMAGTTPAAEEWAAARGGAITHLSGVVNGDTWNGNGTDSTGNIVIWTATFAKATPPDTTSTAHKKPGRLGKVLYPFRRLWLG
jgi:hypothetical protein